MARYRLGAWSQDDWDAAEERDAETRAARPRTPSTSSNPRRCTTCGHWGLPADRCRSCGLPWAAAPLIGPAKVTPR